MLDCACQSLAGSSASGRCELTGHDVTLSTLLYMSATHSCSFVDGHDQRLTSCRQSRAPSALGDRTRRCAGTECETRAKSRNLKGETGGALLISVAVDITFERLPIFPSDLQRRLPQSPFHQMSAARPARWLTLLERSMRAALQMSRCTSCRPVVENAVSCCAWVAAPCMHGHVSIVAASPHTAGMQRCVLLTCYDVCLAASSRAIDTDRR